MNAAEFLSLVANKFPQLRKKFADWDDGLTHLQMMEFASFTQEANEARSFDVVRKSFELADTGLKSGDAALLNATYV